ncbi:MAG: RND family efflux transporter MFP subunit, partial [Bradymonadia bacterium]
AVVSEGDHGHAHADESDDDHGHAHADESDDDHGHPHPDEDDEDATEIVTLWGDTTQLFVEFAALVAGEESSFAAHFTRLSDHLPIATGRVVVELRGGGQTERFTVSEASQPGIFLPLVRPVTAGERTVTIQLTSASAAERHELGTFTVYGSRQAANRAAGHGHDEGADEVSFLLEQQWPINFRIEQTIRRSMRPNVPAFAHFDLPAGSANFATAPREGRIIAGEGGYPQVGDLVEAGDTLFSVALVAANAADPAALDLAVDEAGIRVRGAQREVDRLTPLVAQGVVAQRRLDEATSMLASAQAESRSARRRRGSVGASQQVDSTAEALAVPSPLSGVVAEVRVVPGAWASQGQEIIRIVDPTTLWLDVTVPEAYLGQLERVSGAWIDIQGYDEPLEVGADSLISVGLEVDRDNRTLPVRFRVDNSDRRLFAGMTAQAHLITDTPAPVPAVPMRAIVDDSGIDVVYVQTGGETFERRPVRLGIRDGSYVEVIGVEAGEWVATDGAYSVKIASASTETVGHGHAH